MNNYDAQIRVEERLATLKLNRYRLTIAINEAAEVHDNAHVSELTNRIRLHDNETLSLNRLKRELNCNLLDVTLPLEWRNR